MLYERLYKLVDMVEEELLNTHKYLLPPQPVFDKFWGFVTTDIKGRKAPPEDIVPSDIEERLKPIKKWYAKAIETKVQK